VNTHLWIIIATMIAMGILGGIINYFINRSEENDMENEKNEIMKAVIIGIGASLLVPLFLNMISSNLLMETEQNHYKMLVFAGLCLIASITSKKFISSISEHILKQANEAKEKAKKAELLAQDLKRDIEPILAKETEQENPEKKIEDQGIEFNEDDTDDIKILKALANCRYIYRCLFGISKDAKISQESAIKIITKLISKGMVAQTVRDTELRYFITEKGRKELYVMITFGK
jgi:predicted transcriptional regulator